MERAKEKLAHSLVGRRLHAKQRALPHELADRAAREENEAKAAAKKNTQLRRKQAKRQHERQEAHMRFDGYRSRTQPEPPQRVVPEWELAERWEVGREKAGGLVPTDWHRDAHGDNYTRRCVQWLNHYDEQKRMSALHSLHAFLSPQPADREDDNARRRIDAVLAPHSDHSAPIAAHLRRCLVAASTTTTAAGGHHRSVEEKLVAVMVAGRMGLWCPQTVGSESSSGLLAALTDLATAGPATGDEDCPRRAAAGRVDQDDLRAAAIEVVGVIQFVNLWQMAMMDWVEVGEEVVAMIDSVLMPLCTAEGNSAPVRSAALSAVGLLGTLLSPPDLVAWVEEHVELLLECLEERGVDIDVRQATVDTLLVFLEIVDHARVQWGAESDDSDGDGVAEVESDDGDDGDEDDEEDEALALGQHDLYRLEEVVERLTKERERRADKDDGKRLRRAAERLLRVLRHQHPGDNGAVDGDHAQPEDEECAPTVRRLILRNSCITPNTEVYQPELVVHSAWHQKQLRSIQAIVGASLPIYAQAGLTGVAVADGPLSNIIREMVEQNELVVGYRARRKRGSRASKDPVLAFKRAKGTNRNKHAADYTHTGQPLPVPSLGHSTSARRSSWSERRKKHTLGLWRPVVYSSGRYEPNTNRERPPEAEGVPDEVFLVPHPRFVRLGREPQTRKTESSRKKSGNGVYVYFL